MPNPLRQMRERYKTPEISGVDMKTNVAHKGGATTCSEVRTFHRSEAINSKKNTTRHSEEAIPSCQIIQRMMYKACMQGLYARLMRR